MRSSMAMALFVLATVNTAASAHDCKCLYVGGEVKQGETACIKTPTGTSLARCDMMLNNSSWTVLNKACDVEQSSVSVHSVQSG